MTAKQIKKPGQERIWTEIKQERRDGQDAKWGGPAHDDQLKPTDWLLFIRKQEQSAIAADGTPWPYQVNETYRRRLIKIAALAVAAIESHDLIRETELGGFDES